MVDKSASVSEQKGLVTRATAGALSTSSAWDSLGDAIATEEAEKAKNKPQPQDPPEFVAAVMADAAKKGDSEKAKIALVKFRRLIEKMGGKNENGEDWRPQPIFIASTKSTKNADIAKLVGNGNPYFHGSGSPVPKDMRFFPLFITPTKKLFMEGRPVCVSEDGVTGVTLVDVYPLRGVPPAQNYTAAPAKSIHKCGSDSCPNKPYMRKIKGEPAGYTKNPEFFQSMGQEGCGVSKLVYLIDDQLNDIYVVDVKNQAIKKTAEALARTGFKATGGSWWELSTYVESAKTNAGVNQFYYFQATPTSLGIDQYLGRTIEQFVLHMGVLAERRALARENRAETAQTTISTLESQGNAGDTDQSASEDDVSFPSL